MTATAVAADGERIATAAAAVSREKRLPSRATGPNPRLLVGYSRGISTTGPLLNKHAVARRSSVVLGFQSAEPGETKSAAAAADAAAAVACGVEATLYSGGEGTGYHSGWQQAGERPSTIAFTVDGRSACREAYTLANFVVATDPSSADSAGEPHTDCGAAPPPTRRRSSTPWTVWCAELIGQAPASGTVSSPRHVTASAFGGGVWLTLKVCKPRLGLDRAESSPKT